MSETPECLESAIANIVPEPLQTEDERRRVLEQLYSPIDQEPTRLFALQPGEFDEPLFGSLHVAVVTNTTSASLICGSRRRRVAFQALSYTWGSTILSHPLACNGLEIGITANLFSALQHLRTTDYVLYIWVDAICISQTDNEEKAHQIRNLRHIFGAASEVIAWLGEAHRHTQACIHALQAFSLDETVSNNVHGYHDVVNALAHRTEASRTLRSFSSAWQKFQHRIFLRSRTRREVEEIEEALLDLITRSWLERVWIVQEVFAAKSIIVRCGPWSIDWDAFCLVRRFELEECSNIYLSRGYPNNLGEWCTRGPARKLAIPIGSTKAVEILSRYSQEGRTERAGWTSWMETSWDQVGVAARQFYDLLDSSPYLEATDPRDKIWALVGLSRTPVIYGSVQSGNSDCVAMHIDYNKSLAQVHAETTKFLLNVLEHAESLLPCVRARDKDLPSWTFDFLSVPVPKTEVFLGFVYTPSPFRHRAPKIDFNTFRIMPERKIYEAQIDWSILTLRSWHIGTISSLSSLDRAHVDWYSDAESEYFEHFWRILCGQTSGNKAVVQVRPSKCMQDWITDHFSGWNPLFWRNFISKYREAQEVQTPEWSIAEYASQCRAWGVFGNSEVNDIIVQFHEFNIATILRPLPAQKYYFVGRAWPVRSWLSNTQSEIAWPPPWPPYPGQWSYDVEVPYCPRRSLDESGFEYEEVFHIV